MTRKSKAARKARGAGEASSKAGSAGEVSTKTLSEEKTPASLKPELKIAKKPPSPNPTMAKQSTASTEGQGKPDKPKVEYIKVKIPKTEENREGKNASKEGGNTRVDNQKEQKSSEKLEGMIFMCNDNTKADCFQYMVMGFPEGKRGLVRSIKPDMKLFLYDFNAQLLYGVYKASSAGGMKLEPSAFKGAYPAQVRFKVHLDCQPLPDVIFKKAIKENYDAKRNFFNPKLTNQQVKKLIHLFRSSAPVQSNVLAAAPSHPLPVLQAPPRPITPAVYVPADKDLAPKSEKEYRMYGLTSRVAAPVMELKSEKEYRMYGLTSRVAAPVMELVSNTPFASRGDPYGTGISYRRAPYPSEVEYDHSRSYNRTGRAEVEYGRAAHEAERYPSSAHEAVRYPSSAHEERYHSSSRAEIAPTDDNQRYQLQSRADLGSSSVSSRYSFGGSAFLYR